MKYYSIGEEVVKFIGDGLNIDSIRERFSEIFF